MVHSVYLKLAPAILALIATATNTCHQYFMTALFNLNILLSIHCSKRTL